MKNISRKKLNKILKKHKLWLDSNGKKGKRAFFKNCIICNCSCIGVNLTDAHFEHVILSNVDFSRAILKNVYITDTSISKCWVFQTDFSSSELIDVNLYHLNFKFANLYDVFLEDADIYDTQFPENYKIITENENYIYEYEEE